MSAYGHISEGCVCVLLQSFRKCVSLCDGIYINDEVFKYVRNKMKSSHFISFPYNKINRMKNENNQQKRFSTLSFMLFFLFCTVFILFLLTLPPSKNKRKNPQEKA